jgi:voltage-gated potassium channel
MSKAIDELKDHYVVCGINNVSRNVVDEFFRTNTPFVIIERRKEAIDDLAKDFEFLYIQGDAADDDILKKAGVERAKGLVSALDSDAGNIFVVISARNLNNKLKIVATAIDASAKPKMLKAGADEVISPTQIGGLRIASVMIRPHVVSFLDTFLRSKTNVRFEEVVLKEESKLIGKPFKAAQEAEELGLSVIAIMKKGAVDYVYNHKIHITMEPGDVLVTLGDQPQKEAFMKIYN